MSRKYKEDRDVPNHVICLRLEELSNAVANGKKTIEREFVMRVPAELDRDPDLVLSIASRRLKKFDLFYESVSCLFAEGVEFMNKVELYNSFKKEFMKLSI